MVTRYPIPPVPVASVHQFDRFPYLLTRLTPAGYHVNVLPRALDREALALVAIQQVSANRLPACLCLDVEDGLYIDEDTLLVRPGPCPRGGILFPEQLRVPDGVAEDLELLERRRQFVEFRARHNPGGFTLGDLTKGGRRATADEYARLAGREHHVPRGLRRCERCRDWRGTCIDPGSRDDRLLVEAYCRCDNRTRCARCGSPFFERRVAANYYDEADGSVWHVPGFRALSHRCSDEAAR